MMIYSLPVNTVYFNSWYTEDTYLILISLISPCFVLLLLSKLCLLFIAVISRWTQLISPPLVASSTCLPLLMNFFYNSHSFFHGPFSDSSDSFSFRYLHTALTPFILYDWLTSSCSFPSHLTLSVPHTSSHNIHSYAWSHGPYHHTAQPADSQFSNPAQTATVYN